MNASGEREIGSPRSPSKTTHLIDHGGTVADPDCAHPVCGLDVLLLDRFDRNEAHGRPTGGLDNRLGVVAIVLVGLDEGRHILWADQPNLNAKRMEAPCPVMGGAAGFHYDHPRLQCAHGLQGASHARPSLNAQAVRGGGRPMELEHMFREIDAEDVDWRA